jgi:hypothetical protein
MLKGSLLDAAVPTIASADRLDRDILCLVSEQDVIGLDALISILPQYSWNQVFHAVDRLARVGQLTLRRHRFDYTVFSRTYLA